MKLSILFALVAGMAGAVAAESTGTIKNVISNKEAWRVCFGKIGNLYINIYNMPCYGLELDDIELVGYIDGSVKWRHGSVRRHEKWKARQKNPGKNEK